MEIKTKVCCKCGKEKPISEFGHHHWSKDGYRNECRECHGISLRAAKKPTLSPTPPPPIEPPLSISTKHPNLSNFSNRDLLTELANRGFKGKLEFTKIIDISNF